MREVEGRNPSKRTVRPWSFRPPCAAFRHPKSSFASSGFTLIEILISVAILATAIIFIMQALARGAYVLAVARNRLRAYAFCVTKMAELELGFREGQTPKTHGDFRLEGDRFDWRVDTAPDASDEEFELVTLTVDWQQGHASYESRVSTVRHAAKAEP